MIIKPTFMVALLTTLVFCGFTRNNLSTIEVLANNSEISKEIKIERTRTVKVYNQSNLEMALKKNDVKKIVISTTKSETIFIMPKLSGVDYSDIQLEVNSKALVILPEGKRFEKVTTTKGSTKPILFDTALEKKLIVKDNDTYFFNEDLKASSITRIIKEIIKEEKTTAYVYTQYSLNKALKNKKINKIVFNTIYL